MNQGKRLIRNSVFVLYGAAALYVGLNRVYVSTVDTSTPPWLRSMLTAGLKVAPEAKPVPELSQADLALLRDFTQLSIAGNFTVEIVGAERYKVSFAPNGISTMRLRSWQEDGRLRLVGDSEMGNPDALGSGVLRIETPALTRIELQNVPRLTVQGVQAAKLSVAAINLRAATLRENRVTHWDLYSNVPLEVQVDQGTLAAGRLQTRGGLAIRYGE